MIVVIVRDWVIDAITAAVALGCLVAIRALILTTKRKNRQMRGRN